MKNLTFILLAIIFATSCKKAKIERKLNGTTWKISTITVNDQLISLDEMGKGIYYSTIQYNNEGNRVVFSELNRVQSSVSSTESGVWTIEKIVPTVGSAYYIVKNTLEYNYDRRNMFNVDEYGNELEFDGDNKLIQKEGEYTIVYAKVE